MDRSVCTVIFALTASSVVAAPFQATVIQDVEVRDGALDTNPVVTTITAGSEVTIRDCLAEICLLELPDITFKFAPWADASVFVVGETPATEHAAAQRRSASRVEVPVFLSRNIRTEGDSYMAGAYEVKLSDSIASATGRRTVNSAVGGSEMSQVAERVESPSAAQYLGWVTVFWDGSHNGMTDVESYADQLQSAIEKLGHDHFIVIPAMHGGDRASVIAEFKERWPDNYLGWQEAIGDYQAEIPAEWLARPDEDKVHLNQRTVDLMAEAVAEFITGKGW